MARRGPIIRIRTLFAFLLVIAMLVGNISPAFAAPSPSGATITSDKTDYQPGATVTLTGAGWAPSEVVSVVVKDTPGQTWSAAGQATADGKGDFVCSFQLPSTFYSEYIVTATGATSGVATTTFTDAPALTLTKSASPITYTAAGQVINFSYLLKNTGTDVLNGPFKVTDNKVPTVTCPATATLAVGASITCTGTYTIQGADLALGYVANTASASSSNPGATTSNTDVRIVSIPVDCYNDSDGANDEPGQKDLTQACFAPTSVNPEVISWNWDIISQSGNNSADGCALFDTDNDGMVNYAACVSWQNDRVMQAGYPQLYSCNDTRSDRCAASTPLTITHGTTCALELASDDPFTADDFYPQDTKTVCSINLADVGGTEIASLVDVCSYPSVQPNSDPSDCVKISAAKGNLEVIKSVVPNDPSTNWTLSWTGQTPYSTSVAGSGATGIRAVDTGSYNISETAGSGTNLSLYDSTWACTVDGAPSASGSGTTISGVSVAKGSVVICTFTNTRKEASLEIKKNVVPDNSSTNWNFAVSGPTSFNCSITGDGTCGAKTVFTGSYSLVETAGSGTSLSDYGTTWACTVNGAAGPSGSGSTISGLTLNKNDVVVCTFTNSQSPGSLTVNKKVVPSADTGKFNLLIDGTAKATDVGDGGTTGAVTVSAGSHTISETAGTGTDLSNYVTTFTGDCDANGNVNITAGGSKTCTITNTRRGTIIVEKQTNPDGAAGSFTFTGDAAGTISDNGQIVVSNLAPGTYSSTESSLATDFSLGSISCDDGSSATPSTINLSTKTATFKLDPGETVKCTFTNKKLSPDLVVTKTADAASVTAGDPVGFTITVKNNGQGTANNVTLSDTLPAIPGVAWTIASQPAGTPCTLTSSSLSCSFGNLVPGATAGPVHITGTSTAASCGLWNNTATAQADNNSATNGQASVNVDCATLQITKTASSGTVSAGDPISFTITVTNTGSGTAHNVSVTDSLPTNSGLGSWTLSGADAGACSVSAGVLTCNFGDLTGKASKTVTLTASTTAASCGTVSNTASVTSSNDGSGQSSADITVQCPSLSITKTADAAAVSAGDTIGFTITVSNTGLGEANGVTISDSLPGGLAWSVDAANTTATGCAISGSTLTCGPDTLANGSSVKVHVTAVSTAATCGTLANSATATPTNGDAATSSTAYLDVLCPDLTVAKTGNGPISAGDTATFTITVTNTGLGEAKNVTLTDSLPGGLTWALTPAVAACSISGANPQVLSCNWGTLASGATVSITVSAETSKDNCSTLSNTATATSGNEANTSNNSSGEATIDVNCATIQIEKTTATPTVSAGDPISYTITVTNPGAGTARNVTVTDSLPGGLIWSIDAAKSDSGCSISGSTLTCNFGDMASGGSKSVTIIAPTTYASCGTISNTASVTTSNDGAVTSPGTDINVQCPSLSVTKTADAATVSAGDPIGFTITVANIGDGVAKNVSLSDTLPTGTGISWSINPGVTGCTINSGVLSCTFGDLAKGETKTVHITSSTSKDSCISYDNTATATADNQPSVTSSQASTTVQCTSIQITKTADAGPFSAGDSIGFTIEVTNPGPGSAYGVTITDVLPTSTGLDWTIDPAVSVCSIAGGVLTCNVGTLAANKGFLVHVSSPTTAAACGTVENSASVTTTNDGSGSASDSITVSCPDLTVTKTAASETVNAGDPINFNITVTNTGAGTAKGVTLSDTLPTGTGLNWSVGGTDAASCSIAGGVLTCNFGNLDTGGTKSITLNSPTTAASCATVDNTATVSATNELEGQPNNSSTAGIEVLCAAISITKTADKGTVNAGDAVGFTITVANIGQGTASSVVITDALPDNPGLSWTLGDLVVPASTSGGCSIAAGSPKVLNCNFNQLAAGKSITVQISSSTTLATACATINNTASVTTGNDGSAEASASITVTCASIAISKTPVNASVSAGDTIAYDIVVTNNGLSAASNIAATDTMPANTGLSWSFDNLTAPSDTTGGCSLSVSSPQELSCSFDQLAAGKSITIRVQSTTTAATCGIVSNVASVTTANDGQATTPAAEITVNCSDITVTKEAVSGTINAGDNAAFKIVVSNTGAGTATNVTLTDALPAGVTWTIDPAVTGCTISGNTLSCSFATLASGASVAITVSGATSAAVCGKLDNTATVTASNEANTDNNSAAASITVNCSDIMVAKTAVSGSSVNVGDPAVFQIVISNVGTGTAYDVHVTDTLPAGPGWVLDPPVTGCSITGGVLSCGWTTLAAGASIDITIKGATDLKNCSTYNNTATASASNEANTANNSATASITCYTPAITKTAIGAYDERHEWDVEKTVSPITQNAFAGDTVSYEWNVKVTEQTFEENFTVAGKITIDNKNPEDALTVTLSDVLSDATEATITGCSGDTNLSDGLTIAAGGTSTCDYSAKLTYDNVANAPTSNTATVVLNGISFSASAGIEWAVNVIRGSATLDDDQNPTFPLDITDGGTWTYSDSYTCSTTRADYGETSFRYKFGEDNTAVVTSGEESDSDSASAEVNCYWPQIEITKTGDTLSKIGDSVTYTIKVENNTSTDAGLRNLSCSISDAKIGFNKTLELASGGSDASNKTFTIPADASDPFVNTASVTCSPLNSTFSVSDSASWSTNLFQPAVEIVKTGPLYATSGDVITYSFTINNQSSSDSPNLMLDSVSDNVLGDLKTAALAAGCDNLVFNGTCAFTKTYTVPDVGLQPIKKTNIVTVHYHPAGFPNDIKDTDDHTVILTPRSQLTDTSFCPLLNNQFKLNYHLEAAPNVYRLQASNPGQFYMNGFYYGDPGSDFTMSIQVPYPFVTQEGAGNPIQVHDGTGLTSSGCYAPNPSLNGYTITTPAMSPTSSAGNQIITAEDYTTKQLGQFTTVTVTGKVPATGFAYVTIHLDYGLKKTGSWKATATFTTNPVTGKLILDMRNGSGSGLIIIHGYEVYHFARTVGSDTATTTPSSFNEIKKFAGFLGFVTDKATSSPMANIQVEIYDPSNKLLTTVYTDADGYYMFEYKHKSKSAIYTVKLPSYNKSVPITVKANGFAPVNFEVP